MSEIKTPQAGEWWGDDSGPAFYMIGRNTLGQMVYEVRSRSRSYIENDTTNYWADAVHLPDCTGWDWKEPDWAPLDPETYGWHKLRLKVDQCCGEITGGQWEPVMFESRKPLADFSDLKFRCERKDLPIKPPAKPDPGKGWRLLEPGERVIQGDEYWEPRGTPRWEQSDNWRYRNGEQSSELVYRRRKEKPSAVASLDVYKQVITEREALKSEVHSLKHKLNVVIAQRNEALKTHSEEEKKERDRLKNGWDDTFAQLIAANNENAALKSQISKLTAERNALQDLLREIEAKAKCYEWKF